MRFCCLGARQCMSEGIINVGTKAIDIRRALG